MATNLKIISVKVDSVEDQNNPPTQDFLTTLADAVKTEISNSPDFSGGFHIVQVIPRPAGSNRVAYEVWIENV